MTEPNKVAVICSTGGAGKTQLAVGVGCIWTVEGRHVLMVDTDPQETTSASHWLSKIPDDDPDTATMELVECTAAELAGHLDRIDPKFELVMIDTPPRISDQAIGQVAAQVDLVVIPGNIGGDLEAISETAATIKQLTQTPILVVLSKIDTGQLAKSQEIAADLLALGVGVAGTRIRRSVIADEARLYGEVPTQLKGRGGTNHRKDLAGVAAEILQRLEVALNG